MRRVGYYASLEGNLTVADPNEGLLLRYPRENPTLRITANIDGRLLPLPRSSLTVPGPEKKHGLFCTLGATPFATEAGLDLKKTFDRHLEEPRFQDFGKAVLILFHTPTFIERLERALAVKGYGLIHRPVEYLPSVYAGHWGPFRKLDSYAYQKEYRFLTDRPIPEVLDLELGSLEDISKPFSMPSIAPERIKEIGSFL